MVDMMELTRVAPKDSRQTALSVDLPVLRMVENVAEKLVAH